MNSRRWSSRLGATLRHVALAHVVLVVACDDGFPPMAPEIQSPTDGDVIGDATPEVSGDSEPETTVALFDEEGTLLGKVETDSGSWSITTSELADGEHELTARAVDGAGNESSPSEPVRFTVDTQAPAAPLIQDPEDGTLLASSSFEVSGTAEAGAEVRVLEDDEELGYAEADAEGHWAATVRGIEDGDHPLTATATDAAGNVSPPSELVEVTIDRSAASRPVITSPEDGSASSNPTPEVRGTADPDAAIEIFDDGDVIGSATADAAGTWLANVESLADGQHALTAVATDAAGNASGPSEAVTFTVDTVPPDAPVITSPEDGDLGSAAPSLQGTAEEGATVTVFVNGDARDEQPVALGGTWGADLRPISDGSHTVRATATDAAGNASEPSSTVTFTIDSRPPRQPVITAPEDNSWIGDATPTLSGVTDPGAHVSLTVGDETVEANADFDGSFSLTSPPLPDGVARLAVVATDAAGNTSNAGISLGIDTTAPDAPVFTSPDAGGFLDSASVVLQGTAEMGATVELFDELGRSLGTTVDYRFGWSRVATLAEGDHEVTAVVTDMVGNTSAAATISFHVDLTPPVVSAGTDLLANAATLQNATATDTSPITYAWSQQAGPGTVSFGSDTDEDTTLAASSDGDYVVRLTVTDAAGNVASDELMLRWDTTAPTMVVASPASAETNVGVDRAIRVAFSEPVDASTLAANVLLDGGAVSAVVEAADGGRVARLTPTQPLAPATTYSVDLAAGLTDLVGNPIAPIAWTFTTADAGARSVVSFYSNGRNWNDYLVNDGADAWSASNTVCLGTEAGVYDEACLHAAVLRAVYTGDSSCSGHVASDALGAFEWFCDDSGGEAVMLSSGLAPGVVLSDLIDFDTLQWRPNAVTVSGSPGFTTEMAEWWGNEVAAAGAGGRLATAGTVYVVGEDAVADYSIEATHIAFVVEPGVTLAATGTVEAGVDVAGASFLWLEGSVDASGADAGVRVDGTRFAMLDHVHVSGARWAALHLDAGVSSCRIVDAMLEDSGNGLSLNGADDLEIVRLTSMANLVGVAFEGGAHRNLLDDVSVHDNGYYGLHLVDADDTVLTSIRVVSNDSHGVWVENAHGTVLRDVFAMNNGHSGIRFDQTEGTHLRRAISANNGLVGLRALSTSRSSFADVTVMNNADRGVELVACHDNVLARVTAANSGWIGLDVSGSGHNVVSSLVVVNGGLDGVRVRGGLSETSPADGNTLSNMASVFNDNFGVRIDDAKDTRITGVLEVGSNSIGSCYVDAESASGDLSDDALEEDGVHDGLCNTTSAALSDFVLSTDVVLDGSFVGKVGTDGPVDATADDVNPDDDATPGMVALSEVTDWLGFENRYRAWGTDGSTFASRDNRGRWTTGTGRIWDFSAAVGDVGDGGSPAVRGVLPAPDGDSVLEHAWGVVAADQTECSAQVPGSSWVAVDDCRSTFLREAVELDDDAVGNDNGLCESGEACLYVPNLGSYQGHGALQSAGAFSDGVVTGVTLVEHADNGY